MINIERLYQLGKHIKLNKLAKRAGVDYSNAITQPKKRGSELSLENAQKLSKALRELAKEIEDKTSEE